MTPEDADDFISEYGLEAAKSEIGMTQQPALRAGSLAGQDLSLLKARASTVWSRTRNALCVVQHVEEDVGLHVRWWVAEDGVQLGDVVEAFDYLGERDADGLIYVPEGGWPCNPVPGMGVEYLLEAGGRVFAEVSDNLDWSRAGDIHGEEIIAFRPAPSAVEPASSAGEAGWLSQSIEAAKAQIAADPERHDAIRRNLGLAPAHPQQLYTLAEGLEVTGKFMFSPIDEIWHECADDVPVDGDVIALTPHAEASRLLAEARAALTKSEDAFLEAMSRIRAAEADAAMLREALERISRMEGWTERDGGQSLSDAVDVAAQALQTKERT